MWRKGDSRREAVSLIHSFAPIAFRSTFGRNRSINSSFPGAGLLKVLELQNSSIYELPHHRNDVTGARAPVKPRRRRIRRFG
jgi:hypothetical protein